MPFFSFYKIRKQEGITGSVWGVGTSGKVADMGKGYRRVNMHVNGKMTPVETIPGLGRGKIKENDGAVDSTI
jgi:hypothetical protein